MSNMPLVGEFFDRERLAHYMPELAEYLQSGQLGRSSQAVQRRFKAFIDWVEQVESGEGAEIPVLPVDPSHVLRYARDLDGQDLSLTTIRNNISAIVTVHGALGFSEIGDHPALREFLDELRRKRADSPAGSNMPLVDDFLSRPKLAPYAVALSEYLDSRQSETTAHTVQARFLSFTNWADQLEVEEGAEILSLPVDPSHVLRYARDLDGLNLAMTTIRNYMSSIGTVHRALGFSGPGDHPTVREFLDDLRRRRADRSSRKAFVLSDDEITRVLRSLNTPRRTRGGRMETEEQADARAVFDRALLLTMIQAGLRRSEAARLTWKDIRDLSLGHGVISVPSDRPSSMRPQMPVAKDCMQALMNLRPEDVDGNEHVFGVSDSQITRRLKTMCAAAGIDTEYVSGNTPRATLARILMDRDAPVTVAFRRIRLQLPSSLSDYILDPDMREASELLSQTPTAPDAP